MALNAAVSRIGGGLTVRDSRPGARASGWTMTLAGGGRARVVLRCVSLTLPSGSGPVELRETNELPPAVAIPPGATRRLVASCPRGYLATGYGVDRGERGEVTVAGAVPRARSWTVRLNNAGEAGGRAAVRARCLRASASGLLDGRPASLGFSLARRSASERASGTSSLTRRCRAREFSVATGITLAPGGGLSSAAGGPFGELGGRWSFAGSATPQQVTTHLVCLERSSRFG